MNPGAPEPEFSSPFTHVAARWEEDLGRFGVVRIGRVDLPRAIAWSVVVTWLPLLVLSVVDGVAWKAGLQVPFLRDFLPYGQFLLAVPVLVAAETLIGRRLVLAAAELHRSEVLSPEDRPQLESLLRRGSAMWGGWRTNGVILLVTIAVAVVSLFEVREWLTGGWQYVDDRLTLPGWWYLLIALPIMRFLALRWVWRFLVWSWVLWRTSALDLHPRAEHPDRAGGLAFLGEAQVVFGWIVLAFGAQLACLLADQVQIQGVELMAFWTYVVAYVAIAVCVLVVPLLSFAPKLARARYDTLLFLSGRGFEGAEIVRTKLRGEPGGPLPDSVISGLADYGTLFENARLMRPVPLEWRHIGVIITAAAIAFVPLVFLVMPAQEVMRTVVKLML